MEGWNTSELRKISFNQESVDLLLESDRSKKRSLHVHVCIYFLFSMVSLLFVWLFVGFDILLELLKTNGN